MSVTLMKGTVRYAPDQGCRLREPVLLLRGNRAHEYLASLCQLCGSCNLCFRRLLTRVRVVYIWRELKHDWRSVCHILGTLNLVYTFKSRIFVNG